VAVIGATSGRHRRAGSSSSGPSRRLPRGWRDAWSVSFQTLAMGAPLGGPRGTQSTVLPQTSSHGCEQDLESGPAPTAPRWPSIQALQRSRPLSDPSSAAISAAQTSIAGQSRKSPAGKASFAAGASRSRRSPMPIGGAAGSQAPKKTCSPRGRRSDMKKAVGRWDLLP
jgi:hypothetical protein